MIPLHPNKTYKIRYVKGNVHTDGDVVYFQTLDKVPDAKHLIRVKDLATGEVLDLIELLAHPWDELSEYDGIVPEPGKPKGGTLLSVIVHFMVTLVRFRELTPARSL